ncbi:MAG: GNAT family N-acetyltransferase [Actinomycetales bacterium]|nr:MAG: GNAT family N-acetyltransferase [Actinomycetales bacterium]
MTSPDLPWHDPAQTSEPESAPGSATADGETLVLLADGGEAVIRPLRADDRAIVEALFAAASPADLYTRFFAVGRRAVARHVDHLFDRQAGTMSFLLERQDVLLGLSDTELLDPLHAEVAFLVAGEARGLGVATLLLEHAAECAADRGVTTLVASVLPVNHAMLEVFRDAGLGAQVRFEQEGVSVSMSTQQTAVSTAARDARRRHAERRRLERSTRGGPTSAP